MQRVICREEILREVQVKLVIAYTVFQSPIGPLTLASTEKGLCRVEFGSGQLVQSSLTRWAKRWLLTDKLSYEPQLFTEVIQQLEEYFSGGYGRSE